MEEQRQSPTRTVDPADVAIAADEGRRRRRWRLLVVATLFIALVGYVLSPALFVFLDDQGILSPEVSAIWMFVLWPLKTAHENNETVRDFYDGYLKLMGVNP